MNNLHIVQQAWLRAGAPQCDPDVCLNSPTDCISVCYPDIGHSGYLVLSLRTLPRTFGKMADALDYAASI